MIRRLLRTVLPLALIVAVGALVNAGALLADDDQHRPPQTRPQGFESHRELLKDVRDARRAPVNSAWIVESSRFVNIPAGAFMPDRAFIPGSTDPRNNIVFFDLPVNVGIIKGPDGKLGLADSGWKQLTYIFEVTGSCCWADLREQMRAIGLDPDDVEWIVAGHGHWDHAGQLSSFPNAILYMQREELKQIDFFLDYPDTFDGGHISAVNTLPPFCARTPVCGYPPQTVHEILGKVLAGKAKIIDGRHEIRPGVVIHPAFRGHTYGSQLLQVHTAIGELVFGSDTYSSWEGIRDWHVANVQQTDTIQQFLAYEKCYVLSGGFNNCIAAHEPLSYSPRYPITAKWWTIPDGNCSRAAELVLAPGEPSRIPPNVASGTTVVNGRTVSFRIDPNVCRDTIAIVPPHPVILP